MLPRVRVAGQVIRRRLATSSDATSKAAKSLAEEALSEKTGGASRKKVTAPKGDRKPAKAPGEATGNWKVYATAAGATVGLTGGALFYFGRPFEDGRVDKYASENPLLAAFHRCKDRYDEFESSLSNPIWDKLLPDPLPEPYQRPYTLVINMDETLVYSTWDKEYGWRHAKRPGVDYFLAYMSQFFEIVIFTSNTSMNAQPILDKLDPYQYALYRLYRESSRYIDGKYVKDLSHLNRDLSKVIIMDSNPDAYSLQPENAVPLKPWRGTPDDKDLLEYIPFLEAIALTNVEDVRPVLATFQGKDIPQEWARREKLMNEQIKANWEKERAEKKQKRGLASLLGGGVTQQDDKPPLSFLDQMRKQARDAFAAEHVEMKKAADEQLKLAQEEQARQLKEMKMTVWDLMSQVSSGQPIGMPPPGTQESGSKHTSLPWSIKLTASCLTAGVVVRQSSTSNLRATSEGQKVLLRASAVESSCSRMVSSIGLANFPYLARTEFNTGCKDLAACWSVVQPCEWIEQPMPFSRETMGYFKCRQQVMRVSSVQSFQHAALNDMVLPMEEEDEAAGASASSLWIEFHVLYSTTFRIPELFLLPQDAAGNHLDIEDLYCLVIPQHFHASLQSNPISDIGSLSLTDHPILGVPFYRIHPCQTAQVLIDVAQKDSPDTPANAGCGLSVARAPKFRFIFKHSALRWVTMLAKHFSEVKVAFSPYSQYSKSARIFLSRLQTDRTTQINPSLKITTSVSSDPANKGNVFVKYRDNKSISFVPAEMSIDDIMALVNKHAKALQDKEDGNM